MRLPVLGAALFLGSLLSFTFAEETSPRPAGGVSVQLAAPPLDGTVSIGVFDAEGKCIRVLFKGAEADAIPAALNGFLVQWDGKTAEGTMATKGDYEIRGVTVGEVSIEGEAYHFNDWVDAEKPESSPDSTQLVRLLDGGGFVAAQSRTEEKKTTGVGVFSYSPEGELKWTYAAGKALDLLVAGTSTYVAAADSLIKVESGKLTKQKEALQLTALASAQNRLLGVLNNELVSVDHSTLESTPSNPLPPGTTLLAARGTTVLVSDGASVFKQADDRFEKINLPPLGKITRMAMGKESGFWLLAAGEILTQFDFEGQPLRSLEKEGEDEFLTFDVNADDTKIALVSRKGDRERFRVLQFVDSPSAEVSLWKTLLQKDSQPSDAFGLDPTARELVPRGELPTEKVFTIPLVENPLTPEKKNTLRLTTASLSDGLWLTTNDGLPLVSIASDLSSRRMVVVRGKKPDSLRFYAGIRGSVAEFSLGGLQNMMEFTSEKIQWPPGPAQAADEVNVPSDEPAETPE